MNVIQFWWFRKKSRITHVVIPGLTRNPVILNSYRFQVKPGMTVNWLFTSLSIFTLLQKVLKLNDWWALFCNHSISYRTWTRGYFEKQKFFKVSFCLMIWSLSVSNPRSWQLMWEPRPIFSLQSHRFWILNHIRRCFLLLSLSGWRSGQTVSARE